MGGLLTGAPATPSPQKLRGKKPSRLGQVESLLHRKVLKMPYAVDPDGNRIMKPQEPDASNQIAKNGNGNEVMDDDNVGGQPISGELNEDGNILSKLDKASN